LDQSAMERGIVYQKYPTAARLSGLSPLPLNRSAPTCHGAPAPAAGAWSNEARARALKDASPLGRASSPGPLAADHGFANTKPGRTRSRGGKKKRGGGSARREEQQFVYPGSEGVETPKDGLISNATSLNPGASSFKPWMPGLSGGANAKAPGVNEAGSQKIPEQANQSRINIWVDGPSYGSQTGAVGSVIGGERKPQVPPISPWNDSGTLFQSSLPPLSSSWVPDLPLPDEGSKKMQANGNGFHDAVPAARPAPTPAFKPPPQDDGFFLD
jgi:hypothetical protein